MRDVQIVFGGADSGLLGRFGQYVKEDLRYINRCLDALDGTGVRVLEVHEPEVAAPSPSARAAPTTPPRAPRVATPVRTPLTRLVHAVADDTPVAEFRVRTDCRLMKGGAALSSLQTALCMANVLYERVSVTRTCPLHADLFNPTSYRIQRLLAQYADVAAEPFGAHRTRIPLQPSNNCWTFAVWQLCATTALWSKVTPFHLMAQALTFTRPSAESSAPPLTTLMQNYNAACDTYWKQAERTAHTMEQFGFADCFLYALLQCSGTRVEMTDMNVWSGVSTTPPSSRTVVTLHRFETSKGSTETYKSVRQRLVEFPDVVGGILHVAANVSATGSVKEPHFVCVARDASYDEGFRFYDTNFETYDLSEKKSPCKTHVLLHLYLVSM